MKEIPRFYRTWFYAAALYNAAWGLVVCAFPARLAEVLGVRELVSVPFLQVIGMIVGVFAYGYWLLARDPVRYCGLIWIGLAGKILGPLGFVWHAFAGQLPWSFGATILLNDIVWWPVFGLFAIRYARQPV